MKKTLLLALTVLASAASHAAIGHKQTLANHELNNGIMTSVNGSAFISPAAKVQTLGSFYNNQMPTKKVLKALAKAETTVDLEDLEPAYSMSARVYNSIMGGMMLTNMYDEASFLVEGNKIYCSFFTDIDFIEGTIFDGDNSFKATYGADSVTFTLGDKVVAGDNQGNKYVMATGTFSTTTYTVTRNDNKTIGGYYFADSNELYIPLMALDQIICLFPEDATQTEVIEGYAVASLDLMPQSYLNQYISKATYKATNHSGKELAGDAQVLLAGSSYYIMGFDQVAEKAWVEFELDKDKTTATVSTNQLLGTFAYYTDDTKSEVAWVAFQPVGIASSLTAFTEDYSSGYFVADNDDNTTSVTSDGMSVYGDYGFSENENMGGMWYRIHDLDITITYERAINAAVKGITTTDRAAGTEYYDLQGRKVSESHKGVVIKKTTQSDGSVKSVKLLNK